MGYLLGDESLKQTKALPNGAATIYSTGFDLGHGSLGDHLANCELKISAPALTNAILGSGATMKYSVQHDTDSAFGTAATIMADVLIQTGDGAGAAASSVSVRLPVDVKRYVRVRAINSAAGNASTVSLTEQLLF